MAAIKLSQLYGGGQFKAEFFSGALTHSLSSVTPLVISPAAGKTLRLDFLSSSVSNIANSSVSVGSVIVVGGETLAFQHANVGFLISNVAGSSNNTAISSNTVQPLIAFDSDQAITITTTTATATTINYSYSYGE